MSIKIKDLKNRYQIAQEALASHAKNLETEFPTSEEFRGLFVDTFGEDINSAESLTKLKKQFADGTLRPKVKFVNADTLTNSCGNVSNAAFDAVSQTILLLETLYPAEIKSSIEREIGHWWDMQLNGTKDSPLLKKIS